MTSEKIYKYTILIHIVLFIIMVLLSMYPSKTVVEDIQLVEVG